MVREAMNYLKLDLINDEVWSMLGFLERHLYVFFMSSLCYLTLNKVKNRAVMLLFEKY